MAAVEVVDLTVRYGTLTALDGVSFTVDAGAVVALLGPNGAGKTTTTEALEGFRRPDAGSVRVLGWDPIADKRQLVQVLGAMPQSSRLYAAIRPIEALKLFASYYRHPEDPDQLLARVGLAERARTPWRKLSGGEQQRLSLALALVGRPEAVVLDEPTAGLDVAGRGLVRTLIAELAGRGVAVLLTTHELDEVERSADRVVIIDRGRVVADGSLSELARQAGAPQIRFSAAPGLAVAELAAALGVPMSETSPGEYLAEADPSPANVARLTAALADRNLELGNLRAGQQRLEDLFARLTGGGTGTGCDTGGAE